MDRAHLAVDRPVTDLQGIGVGVYKGASHIGMIYRDSGGMSLDFLHLASHEDLCNSADISGCLLWVEAKLEQEQANVIAAQARLIYRKNSLGGVPYGFSPYPGYFGAAGTIDWGSPGNGLTCATFVLAVFDRGGVRLVKGETWPTNREEDKKFQNEVIKSLRKRRLATESHLDGLRKDIGQVRFQVLEVAGAVAAEVYPVEFTTAHGLGLQLDAMMMPPSDRAGAWPVPE